MNKIQILKPDDWHLHLRDAEALKRTVTDVASHIHRAIIMPNLVPPVTTVSEAQAYRDRILAHKNKTSFSPLMTLYLTDNTTVDEIKAAGDSPFVVACKLYPAGATTNSDSGVTDVTKLDKVFEAMTEAGLILCIHGEVTDNDVDIFDREKVFIERHLKPITDRHPNLKIVLEHITTQDAVDFVLESSDNIAATITAHHLILNRNDLLSGGIKPDYYCLPILKRQAHQKRLQNIVLESHPKFFFGSDSAPHGQHKKYNACGCAGIYTAPVMLCLLAEFFEQHQSLSHFEPFVSRYGANFYNLPPSDESITLTKESWSVPSKLPFGDDEIVPFFAGKQLSWRICDV